MEENSAPVEIWKPIPGIEGWYEASSFGRIRSLKLRGVDRAEPYVLKAQSPKSRYVLLEILIDGERSTVGAHQLVCAAFHGPRPEGYEVAHGNGNSRHNMPNNLRWATHQDNIADRVLHGTVTQGQKCRKSNLTPDDIREIRISDKSRSDLGRVYGVSATNIGYIQNRKIWKFVE